MIHKLFANRSICLEIDLKSFGLNVWLLALCCQVNKNPFGFAPKEQLVCPEIQPGSSAEAAVGRLPQR